MDELAARLERELATARDAGEAWRAFAPELTYGRHRMPPPPTARQAAVLVLLYGKGNEWYLPLIERTADRTVHSGQISFPGGALEVGEIPEAAVLREFEEELGVAGGSFRLCGRLTQAYIYASNFVVTPCVAISSSCPEFHPSPFEVARVLEFPIAQLFDPVCIGSHQIRRRGLTFAAPHWEHAGCRIWGATSMMLAELREVLRGIFSGR